MCGVGLVSVCRPVLPALVQRCRLASMILTWHVVGTWCAWQGLLCLQAAGTCVPMLIDVIDHYGTPVDQPWLTRWFAGGMCSCGLCITLP